MEREGCRKRHERVLVRFCFKHLHKELFIQGAFQSYVETCHRKHEDALI